MWEPSSEWRAVIEAKLLFYGPFFDASVEDISSTPSCENLFFHSREINLCIMSRKFHGRSVSKLDTDCKTSSAVFVNSGKDFYGKNDSVSCGFIGPGVG